MINWIIGGLIIGAALYIIIKSVLRLRKGDKPHECAGCSGGACCSEGERNICH